jgi:hypothetical protein
VKSDAAVQYRWFPWIVMRIGALFVPTWASLLEMRYLWDKAHALDNRKLVALLDAEPHTCRTAHSLDASLVQDTERLGFHRGRSRAGVIGRAACDSGPFAADRGLVEAAILGPMEFKEPFTHVHIYYPLAQAARAS